MTQNTLLEKVLSLQEKFASLQEQLSSPEAMADMKKFVQLNKDYKELEPIIKAGLEYKKTLDNLASAKDILLNEKDEDLREMAREEIAELEPKIPDMEANIKLLLIPADPDDGKNAIVEIRGGAGGDEAAIFAGDLFRMYSRYAETRGWKTSVMHSSATSLDGYKEIVFTVAGEDAYGTLRFESGGHRVQRVPATEAQGRIHTSAATVVVFPEANEQDDIDIPEKDIRIDLFCAGGAGGQHVNKTESAVRMTHLPTGLVAVCQDERSQIRNREKCLATLKARVLDLRRREEEAKTGADRMTLRGSGDRSEKIRTYNFPQNRVTDHRIGLTLYSLDRIIDGAMAPLLDALRDNDVDERLKAAVARV